MLKNLPKHHVTAIGLAALCFFVNAPSASAMTARSATPPEVAAAHLVAGDLYLGSIDTVVFEDNARVADGYLAVGMTAYAAGSEYERGIEVFALTDSEAESLTAIPLASLTKGTTCNDTRGSRIEDVITDALELVRGTDCSHGRPAVASASKMKTVEGRKAATNRGIRQMNSRMKRCSIDRFLRCALRLERRYYLPKWRRLNSTLRSVISKLSWSHCSDALSTYHSTARQHRRAVRRVIRAYASGKAHRYEDATVKLKSVGERSKSSWQEVEASCYPA